MLLHDEIKSVFWNKGARPSLKGALLKMGIQTLDQKPEPAGGNGNSNSNGDDNDNGNGNGNSEARSICW